MTSITETCLFWTEGSYGFPVRLTKQPLLLVKNLCVLLLLFCCAVLFCYFVWLSTSLRATATSLAAWRSVYACDWCSVACANASDLIGSYLFPIPILLLGLFQTSYQTNLTNHFHAQCAHCEVLRDVYHLWRMTQIGSVMKCSVDCRTCRGWHAQTENSNNVRAQEHERYYPTPPHR